MSSRFFNFDQPQPLRQQSPRTRLSALLAEIRGVIEGRGAGRWVVAEIAEIRRPASGHVYLELVEREGETLVARCRLNCWRTVAQRRIVAFEKATGTTLSSGMSVLIRVRCSFHAQFGFALILEDIDASYTLGEMERRRQAIVQRLRAEDALGRNATCTLPLLCRRIAVISAAGAAGFEDFCTHIHESLCASARDVPSFPATMEVTLFPASMQGSEAEASVLAQLRTIAARASAFDLVVIVRGGGARVDLSCFDSYALGCAIADFPLPVISGIGHDRDTSVVDLVAHTAVKTPTAAAEFLTGRMREVIDRLAGGRSALHESAMDQCATALRTLQDITTTLEERSRNRLERARQELESYGHTLARAPRRILQNERVRLGAALRMVPRELTRSLRMAGTELDVLAEKLTHRSVQTIQAETKRCHTLETLIRASDPQRLLARGYTLTYAGDTLVKEIDDLEEGAELRTVARGGMLTSRVIRVAPSPSSLP